MTAPVPLSMEDLSVSFRREPIFAGVSLDVRPGEFVTIMGENGSGKTLLLETLMGLHEPQRGRYALWGETFAGAARSRLNRRIGWVLSQREDYPVGLTVDRLFALHRVAQPGWDEAFVRRLVAGFDLDPRKRLHSLSLGEHSKVRLIKALAHHPELLILDELTANLSPESKKTMLGALVDRFVGGRLAVLAISHAREEAHRLSDRTLWLTSTGLVPHQGVRAC